MAKTRNSTKHKSKHRCLLDCPAPDAATLTLCVRCKILIRKHEEQRSPSSNNTTMLRLYYMRQRAGGAAFVIARDNNFILNSSAFKYRTNATIYTVHLHSRFHPLVMVFSNSSV